MTALKIVNILFRPSPGEIRQIYIEKSSEPLGITIDEGSAGTSKKGVFVASVSENSLAYQVGLQVNCNSICFRNLLRWIRNVVIYCPSKFWSLYFQNELGWRSTSWRLWT